MAVQRKEIMLSISTHISHLTKCLGGLELMKFALRTYSVQTLCLISPKGSHKIAPESHLLCQCWKLLQRAIELGVINYSL